MWMLRNCDFYVAYTLSNYELNWLFLIQERISDFCYIQFRFPVVTPNKSWFNPEAFFYLLRKHFLDNNMID